MTDSASAIHVTELPIRPEVQDAHARLLEHRAGPGAWWTGEERLAIVEEVRRARNADELPPWVSPTSVDGLMSADRVLPDAAIDVVWRLNQPSGHDHA